MNKLNKKFAQAFLALGVLAMAPLAANADASCDPCGPCGLVPCEECDNVCDCCADITLDFLLWKPCVDGLDYALVTEPSGVSTVNRYAYRAVDPDWDAGIRVVLSKPGMCNGWGVSASYTFMTGDTTANLEVNNQTIYPVATHPVHVDDATYTSASSTYEYHYNAFDVLFNHPFVYQRCHQFTPYVGVQGLVHSQDLEVNYSDGTDNVHSRWDSDFIGAGLKVGTDYVYQAYDCLALFVRASGSIVVGESDSWVVFTDASSIEHRYADDDNTRFLNGYHFQVGFLYDWNLCGCDTNLRLGYEFVKWHNVSNPRHFVEADSNSRGRSTSPDTTTLGFHGLLAGVEMKF